ncbi:TPA: hypothetical protein DIS56_01475 [Candidatus Saccharibacteria bacterium]|nr:MAG: hypothetical protein A3F05_04025 [Candidatus Saccharibacteria bacterium RIFCSPHIGHO2_12_FULL_47_17]HCM51785.1 hypothetical protein [Candidatus Saccharibacteria bacterium]
MAHVLVIESDRIVADNITQMLEQAGHRTSWHLDPQGAIDGADSKAPDAIIIDLMLAGRSGVEFLYEFRSYPQWQKLPVIVFSDVTPEEFNGAGTGFSQLNVAAYHHKPVTKLSDLLDSVKTVLQPAAA